MMHKSYDSTLSRRSGLRAAVACVVAGVLIVPISGCSSDEMTVSDVKKERVVVQVNDDDCVVDDENTAIASDGEIGDMETNAKKTYYVLKEMGYSDENIAGVLGNWNTESSLDPTGVETIFDEPFQMGPKKTAAMEDPNGFTLNTVFPAYAGRIQINKEAYKGDDGQYYPGIGLAGFTGPATTRLLKYAEKHSMPWYSFDLQLSFSITEDEGGYGRSEFWKNWGNEASCESAAETFLAKYEGCPGMMLYERQQHAREWMEKIKTWNPDSSYAKSIINLGSGASSTAKKPTARTKTNKSVTTSDAGTKIDIPDEFDSKQQNYGYGSEWQILIDGIRCSTGWVQWGKEGNGGAAGEQARKWVKDGRKYAVGKDLVLIDGRIGVVVKETFGKSGDYVDVVYKDGNVLHGVIIDNQGATDDTGPGGSSVPWAKYGHNVSDGACNVLEWYSDGGPESHLWRSGQNPCSIPGFEYITGVVDYIINTNGVNTGSAMDGETASDEACEEAETEAGMDVAAGEAAQVEDSYTARIAWLYPDGQPTSFEEASKYFEEFEVVIRKEPGGEKGTMKVKMHKKLKAEVQAIFNDIYANTDYRINPGDCNTSERGWEVLGSGNPSQHSLGNAIDINASHNAGDYHEIGTWNPGSDPLSMGADHKVVQIMKKHGFSWGGAWSGATKCDPMHFSYTGR